MRLTINQIVDTRDDLVSTKLELGQVNKFTGNDDLVKRLFSSIQNIFDGKGVSKKNKETSLNNSEIVDLVKSDRNNFVLEVDSKYFEKEPALYVKNDKTLLFNDRVSDAGNLGKLSNDKLIKEVIDRVNEELDFTNEPAELEGFIVSMLWLVRQSRVKRVVFGLDFTNLSPDLIYILGKEIEDSSKELETVIFYDKTGSKVVGDFYSEFIVKELNDRSLGVSYKVFERLS